MNNNRFERSIQDLNLWISKNLEGFSPNCWINGNEDLISTIKKFAELLYIDNMFYPINVFGKYSIEIEAFVKKNIEIVQFQDFIVRNMALITPLLVIDEYCENHNIIFHDDRIKWAVESGMSFVGRRAPFRIYELAYQLKRCGYLQDNPLITNAEAVVNRQMNISWSSFGMDAYVITHSVFYMTDSGTQMITNRHLRNSIRLLLIAIIANNYLEENIDILAEAILGLCFIQPDKVEMSFIDSAIEYILSKQNLDGSFYGPKSNELRDLSEFEKKYHTTLVVLGVLNAYKRKEY